MRLSFGQEVRQEQRQVLTQRMIQSMEILQMSLLELEEHIQQELEQNPLLEIAEVHAEPEPELLVSVSETIHDDFDVAREFAETYRDTIDELPGRSQNWLDSDTEWRDDVFANIPGHDETLPEHLAAQLMWYNMDDSLRQMAERIIYNLDRNGYLSMTDAEFLGTEVGGDTVRNVEKLAEKQRFETALTVVRSLEPTGVGARNLTECLLLQLHSGLRYEELLRELVTNHLDDLIHNRLPLVSKRTAINIPTIQAAMAELKHLNPRPGATFATQPSPPIFPDVVAERNSDGTYTVQLTDDRMTHLKISHHYQNLLQKEDTQKDTREYIQQKIGSAQWLIAMIQQRKHTLQRVSQAVVDHQTAFLEYGPSSMKPLIMQQIADKVGVHVTTVSRACDGKWIQTPQGALPLKRFFIGAIASSDQDDEVVTQDAALLKLKEIVEKENRKNPYSDEELVLLMNRAGIKLARRTIAKYRTVLNIPSSRERKIWG